MVLMNRGQAENLLDAYAKKDCENCEVIDALREVILDAMTIQTLPTTQPMRAVLRLLCFV